VVVGLAYGVDFDWGGERTFITFTVDVKTWWRGNGRLGSMRRSDGTMCCLGHRAKALGQSARSMINRGLPSEVKLSRPKRWKGLVNEGAATQLCCDIAEINDAKDLTDPQRKSRLRQLFQKIGDTIKFSDDPPDETGTVKKK